MSRAKAVQTKRPRRASQRVGVAINLANDLLRDLMTEQCRHEGGYLTIYRGLRTEFLAAGIPEAAFPAHGDKLAKFQVQTLNACCTGSHELLSGSMNSSADGYELEIDWGTVRPYVQCSHPAIAELARMLLNDVRAWTNAPGPWTATPDLAYPMDLLADDERAVDYKPRPGAPRLQVTAEFHKKLSSYASCLYEWVYTDCEVLPLSAETAAERPTRGLRLIVDNARSMVQP